MANDPITLDMSTSQPLNAPVTLDMSTSQPLGSAPASQPGAYQTKPGGPIRNVNPPTDRDTSDWPHVKLSSGEVHQVHPEDVNELMRREPGALVTEDTGVVAGLKRIPDAISGLYHAFAAPATEQEKADLLAKVREQNAKGDQIPEDLATNPSRATLALHRLVDAPALRTGLEWLQQEESNEAGED